MIERKSKGNGLPTIINLSIYILTKYSDCSYLVSLSTFKFAIIFAELKSNQAMVQTGSSVDSRI